MDFPFCQFQAVDAYRLFKGDLPDAVSCLLDPDPGAGMTLQDGFDGGRKFVWVDLRGKRQAGGDVIAECLWVLLAVQVDPHLTAGQGVVKLRGTGLLSGGLRPFRSPGQQVMDDGVFDKKRGGVGQELLHRGGRTEAFFQEAAELDGPQRGQAGLEQIA